MDYAAGDQRIKIGDGEPDAVSRVVANPEPNPAQTGSDLLLLVALRYAEPTKLRSNRDDLLLAERIPATHSRRMIA